MIQSFFFCYFPDVLLYFEEPLIANISQALRGSEAVEIIDGKIRKKDNPAIWAIPPDQPVTGICFFHLTLVMNCVLFENRFNTESVLH